VPKDYSAGANNFGVVQDKKGLIYVANDNGILVYNGLHWILCSRNDEVTITSIFSSKSGEIYFGSKDGDFGMVQQAQNGKFIYYSLANNLKEAEKPQESIKHIVSLKDAVYFLSADKLIEYKNGLFKAFNPTNAFHIRAFVCGEHLFVCDIDNSFLVLENGVLNPVSNTEELSSKKPFFNYPISSNEFAFGIRVEGIYKMDYNIKEPSKSVFKKYAAPCDNELSDVEINNGTLLKNGNFIATTNKKGAFVLNKNLEIVTRYNTKNGLNDENVKSVFEDLNGNLWFSLFYGISYIEANSGLNKYTRDQGINGPVQSATYFNGVLYIATDKGIQYFNTVQNHFEELLGFNKQTWFLLNYNNNLFISTDKGIFIYNGKTITQVSEKNTQYLLNDPYQNNVIYAATEDGVDVYNLSGSVLMYVKSYNLNSKVICLAADENKNIYFGTENTGIYFLNYSRSYLLDSIRVKDGLPSDDRENFLFTINNKLFVATNDGIYSLIKKGENKFVFTNNNELYALTKKIEIFRASELDGDILCNKNFENRQKNIIEKGLIYLEMKDGRYRINNKGITHLKDVKPNNITFDKQNNIAFIASDEGLFILKKQQDTVKKQFSLFLRSVLTKDDTISLNRPSTYPFAQNKPELAYSDNDIKFSLAVNCYENLNNISISYYLEGKDKDYGINEKKFEVNYSNLFEGDYIFHVKAFNELTDEVIELHYPFTILSPWYRSVWAYIAYAIIFIALIYVIVKLNTKRLMAQNIKLEGIITQRTATIEEQKILVELKHKEITDSINYAERIQRSMLASRKLLNENLNVHTNKDNYFIFFKPKDIVSGDFYWASKLPNNTFCLVTADSTGHGVPGAIMSMLNMNSLKEAVIKNLNGPADILNYTRQQIIETLANDGSETGGKDGMDCSCLVFDFNRNTLTWTAANNPVWIVSNAGSKENVSLTELKPQKMPVGKHERENESFKQETLQLKKGDMIYAITDGFPDQFGGEKGKKFMSKNLKELLCANAHLPMQEQKEMLERTFKNWVGDLEQIDDVTIIGIRV